MGGIHIGEHTYITGGSIINRFPAADLYIGKFCSIGSGLKCMLGGNHPMNLISTFPFSLQYPDIFGRNPHPAGGYQKGNIYIENDVWIGEDVIILSGVTIGSGAIIGTASTVTKSVPPYAIVAGNPARIKKYRFNSETIIKLLKISWWDWSLEKIREHYDLFHNSNIELFINKFYEDK